MSDLPETGPRGGRGILLLRVLLTVAVLAVGVLGATALIEMRRPAQKSIARALPPLVRVLPVEPRDTKMTVRAYGTVQPRTESSLVAEVGGRVLWISPSFRSGGFFEEGDVLLRIDPADYRQALAQARSAVAQAELLLERERAAAELARKEWEELGRGDGTPLALHEPQVRQAEAAFEAARAVAERAERDLARTEVKAPYAGRVRVKSADLGQFLAPGAPIARIYAVDYAEIRLPLESRELAYLELPMGYRRSAGGRGPEVKIRAEVGGREWVWSGRVERTEGEIDPRTRTLAAIARVDDPYSRSGRGERPPLAVGMFVTAEIAGVTAEGVVAMPQSALRAGDEILVVDSENRLYRRAVEVYRRDGTRAYLSGGVEAGERICLTPLSAIVDGMEVRTGGTDLEQGEDAGTAADRGPGVAGAAAQPGGDRERARRAGTADSAGLEGNGRFEPGADSAGSSR